MTIITDEFGVSRTVVVQKQAQTIHRNMHEVACDMQFKEPSLGAPRKSQPTKDDQLHLHYMRHAVRRDRPAARRMQNLH